MEHCHCLVRKARPEELDAIIALEAEGFPPAEAADADTLRARFAAYPACFWVALQGDVPVGYAAGAALPTPYFIDSYYSDTACHMQTGGWQAVFGLVVAPAWQHRRIGEALLAAFAADARAAGRLGMVLTCKEQLIPFYTRCGYSCRGVSESVHGGVVWYDMVLAFAPKGAQTPENA